MTSSFNWLLCNITCCLYKTLCAQNLWRDESFHLFYLQVWLLSENPGVPCFHLSQHSASPWCWTKPPGDSVTLICLFVSLSVCLFVFLSVCPNTLHLHDVYRSQFNIQTHCAIIEGDWRECQQYPGSQPTCLPGHLQHRLDREGPGGAILPWVRWGFEEGWYQ